LTCNSTEQIINKNEYFTRVTLTNHDMISELVEHRRVERQREGMGMGERASPPHTAQRCDHQGQRERAEEEQPRGKG
jgi:hypothetical protein